MSYVSRLTRALDEGQFVLYQQSLVPLQPGARPGVHFEVLLRLIGEDGRNCRRARSFPRPSATA